MASERTKPQSSEIEDLKRSIRMPGEVPYVKICAYGRNGSGKTRLAATAPKVIIAEFPDETDRSIKGVRGARVVEMKTWNDVGLLYWFLKSGDHPFESVALDTITAMNNLALSFVLGEAEDRDPTRERSQPDKRTWGRAGQLMKGMLMAFHGLPMHTIFLAQERKVKDQDTEEVLEITVDLPNSSRGVALGSVGVLGRMVPRETRVRVEGKVKRRWVDYLVVAPHEIIWTKDQTHLLGDALRAPTIPKIMEAWAASPPKAEE